MPLGDRILNIWSSNIAEVASLGHVGSNAYLRIFDQNNRTGKAVAFGVRDQSVYLYNMSTGSNANAMSLGIGKSNPTAGSLLDVAGLVLATNVVANIDGSNLTSGIIVKERLADSGVTSNIYGASNTIVRTNVDRYGRVISASNVMIFLDASNINSGALNVLRLPTSGVTAGSYGNSNTIPRVTVDTYGRVTAVTLSNVTIGASAVTSGVLPIVRGGTGFSTWNSTQVVYGNASGALEQDVGLVYISGTKRLGIGTTAPVNNLHVVGDAYISGTVNCSNISFFSSNVAFNTIEVNITYSDQLVASNVGTGPALYLIQSGDQPLADFVDAESGIALRIANNGNTGFGTSNPNGRVHIFTSNTIFDPLYIEPTGKKSIVKNNGTMGIGTTTPDTTYDLHVFGAVRVESNLRVFEDVNFEKRAYAMTGVGIGTTSVRVPTVNLLDVFTGASGTGVQVAAGSNSNVGIRLVSGTGSGASVTQYNGALDVDHGLALFCRQDSTVRHVFDTRTGNQYNVGNLGLGVVNPTAKLDVDGTVRTTTDIIAGSYLAAPAGTAAAPSIRVGGSNANEGLYTPNTGTLGLVTEGVERVRVGSNGMLAVALSNTQVVDPVAALHLQGSNPSLTDPAPTLQLHNFADTGGAAALDFCTIKASGPGTAGAVPMARVMAATDSNNTSADLLFLSKSGTTLSERARLTSDGRLGIGTSTPQSDVLLQVAGNARVDQYVYVSSNTGYSWLSDTTTYVHRPATGVIGLTCGGAEKFRITSNDNVGFFTGAGVTPTGFQVNALGLMGPGGTTGGSAGFGGGPFFRQSTWTATGSSHTLSYSTYCMGDNSSGTIFIQAIQKGNPGKTANAMASFVKRQGGSLDLFVVSLHKSDTMNTFTVQASANDILVTTDANCRVCWTSIGAF